MPLDQNASDTTNRFNVSRVAPLILIIALAGLVIAMGWHRQLSFEALVRNRAALEQFIAAHYGGSIVAFMFIYVAVVSLSLPGGAFLTITSGILFGWIIGGAISVVAATIGATFLFLIARTAIGEYFVRRAGPRLARLVKGFRAEAFSYLLFLRLVPLFPFVLVNLAPALVGIPLATFFAATALGVIPATFVFASVGAGLDSVISGQGAAYRACLAAGRDDCRLDVDATAVFTPELLAALTALGLLALAPVLIKRFYVRVRGPLR